LSRTSLDLIFVKCLILFIDKYMNNFGGQIRGIRFLIKDEKSVRIWKPTDMSIEEFRPHCDLVVKYIIDEGFYSKKSCKVEIVS
jgi:hypothetical protein